MQKRLKWMAAAALAVAASVSVAQEPSARDMATTIRAPKPGPTEGRPSRACFTGGSAKDGRGDRRLAVPACFLRRAGGGAPGHSRGKLGRTWYS